MRITQNRDRGAGYRALGRSWAACVVGAALLLLPLAATGDAGEQHAENLVRAVYYEGIPYAEAAQVSEAGAARLIEMLRDPAEASYHGQIISVLGMCGHPGAYEALMTFVAQLRDGELDRNEFRAWRALAGAMGYLARRDPRALAWLIAQAREPGEMPSFRHYDLGQLRKLAAVYGLGTSGRPQAGEVLRELASESRRRSATGAAPAAGDELSRSLAQALELHAAVSARENAQGVVQ